VAALKNLERWAYGPLARLDEDRDHFRSKLRSYLGGQHREPKLVLEGEVVSGTFAKTVGDVRRKDATATDAVYEIFDAISMESFLADDSTEPYSFRRLVIESFDRAIISGSLTILERRLAGSHEEIQAIYESYRDAGHEGGMVKPLDGLYQKKRSHAWLKMKNEDSEDLMVIGVFEGEGKYAGMLGGLIVDRNGVAVKVGAGFSDQQRKTFWTNDEDVRGRVIEVEYHEVLESGSLRHPRFVAFRDTAEAPGIKI
jgi:DNA ligase-1